jgi:L-ribulose-5-phosphate 4-epimerase
MKDIYKTLREEAYEANMEIPARGLAIYTWGNVSAFDKDAGVFAIKPSGVPYSDLSADDMVIIDLDGNKVDGALKPSSDTPTHRVLYKAFADAGVRGVTHTHSPYATAWAQACRAIPVFGTTHADHSAFPVPCTPYLSEAEVAGDYELETGAVIARTLVDKSPLEIPFVLVGGHGPFAWGASAAKSVYNAAVLEETAKMALFTAQISPDAASLPSHIIRKHYERKHGAHAYYGQG